LYTIEYVNLLTGTTITGKLYSLQGRKEGERQREKETGRMGSMEGKGKREKKGKWRQNGKDEVIQGAAGKKIVYCCVCV
jgi:hypothetical protein